MTHSDEVERFAREVNGVFEALAKADERAAAMPLVRAGILLERRARNTDMTTVRVEVEALRLFLSHTAIIVADKLRAHRLADMSRADELRRAVAADLAAFDALLMPNEWDRDKEPPPRAWAKRGYDVVTLKDRDGQVYALFIQAHSATAEARAAALQAAARLSAAASR